MHSRLKIAVCTFSLLASAGSALAQQRALSDILVEGAGWELVAEGFKFLEGPAVDAKGVLYFSDVPTSKIYRLNAAGQPEVFVANSEVTNGLMFGPDGLLYGCQTGKRRIVAFDKEGKATEVQEDVLGNDLAVTRDGGIYVTDPEDKLIIYIPKTGKARIVDRGMTRPNGIALWAGQGTLVVSDTLGQNIWAFQVESDGSLSNKEKFYQMIVPPEKAASGADGMTLDTKGRLYVATYVGVQIFDAQGRLLGVIEKPQNAFLSNVKFGSPNFDTLYATSTDKLYRRKLNATGAR